MTEDMQHEGQVAVADTGMGAMESRAYAVGSRYRYRGTGGRWIHSGGQTEAQAWKGSEQVEQARRAKGKGARGGI